MLTNYRRQVIAKEHYYSGYGSYNSFDKLHERTKCTKHLKRTQRIQRAQRHRATSKINRSANAGAAVSIRCHEFGRFYIFFVRGLPSGTISISVE
jgi:hypothetical protein